MTRAYLRLDPAFDEHKESYPDGPYATLIATFCLAEQQPSRGRFRSLDYLRRVLGKRGKFVAYLVDKGDIVELPDGRIYVDGWDEWQEGDWKVAERVERIRNRKKRTVNPPTGNGPVTPPVTVAVTPEVTPPVTASRKSVAVLGVAELSAGADNPPPPAGFDDEPEGAALSWLARHGCYVAPGNGYHRQLVTASERHGVETVIRWFEKLGRAGVQDGDTKGFIFGAVDALKGERPTLKHVRDVAEGDEQRATTERDYERTAQRRRALEALPEPDPAVVAEAMAKMREAAIR